MRDLQRLKFILHVTLFALVFSLTAKPTLNAADPESADRGPVSLAQSLLERADLMSRTLHEKPLEQRSPDDYRRTLDAYAQVIRLNTDNYFSAESLLRTAELEREIADASNDSARYATAISTFRKLVEEHPQSSFVGDALMAIAEIYEENLQDLEGAAAAFRQLIDHFPQSVMSREGSAVLSRFEAELSRRPADVLIPAGSLVSSEELDVPGSRSRITNVRNFSGGDYARVVIDLSRQAAFAEKRSEDKIIVKLDNIDVSALLAGRKFIVADKSLLKRITVAASKDAKGVEIEIQTGKLGDFSMFRLPEPERIIIDLHGPETRGAATASSSHRIDPERDIETQPASEEQPSVRPPTVPRTPFTRNYGRAILSLPEITEPIMPLNSSELQAAAKPGTSEGAVAHGDAQISVVAKDPDAPVKRIVIDPGHGGHDTGTISPNGINEKDLVLDVARRLRAYIKRTYPDIEVILTRESDRFIALEERTAIANSRRADLFISIHANASPSRIASGVETFFVSPDRAKEIPPAQDPEAAKAAPSAETGQKSQPVFASVTIGNRVAESRELARYIQAGLVRGIGAASPRTAANRGVKHAPFAVLVGAAMPSVLAEVSFLSNPKDEALLQTPQFRERIAASLFAGFNAYLKKNRAAQAKQTQSPAK